MIPGETLYAQEPIRYLEGQVVTRARVENTGDRPVQVGSHFHFAEANSALEFDREAAMGQRLAVLAGTSVRFEPGIAVEVELVPFGGDRYIAGFRGLVKGRLPDA